MEKLNKIVLKSAAHKSGLIQDAIFYTKFAKNVAPSKSGLILTYDPGGGAPTDLATQQNFELRMGQLKEAALSFALNNDPKLQGEIINMLGLKSIALEVFISLTSGFPLTIKPQI